MYQFRRILKMDTANLFTNGMWWMGTIALSFVLTIVMGFITQGSYGGTVSSYDYYAIAMLVFGVLNNSSLAANSFMETRIMKANMRLCTAPVSDFHIIGPKILASFTFGTVCLTLVGIALHLLFGVNFGGSNWVFYYLLMLALNLFSVTLGVLVCTIFKNEEMANQVVSTLVSILCLLGGVFFPLKGLGSAIAAVSEATPVTWVMNAAFRAIYDGNLAYLGWVTAGLVGLSVLFTLLSIKRFHREDYL